MGEVANVCAWQPVHLQTPRLRDSPEWMSVDTLSKSTESLMNFLWTWAVLVFMIIIITLKQNSAKPWVRNATALVNPVFSPCHISEVAN